MTETDRPNIRFREHNTAEFDLPLQPLLMGRYPIPAATMTVTYQAKNKDAVLNAIRLLEVLYGRGVASPEVLEVILEATGHRAAALTGIPDSSAEAGHDQ